METTRGEETAYFLLMEDIPMDGGIMESLITLIQGVGFPIACAVAMFVMLNKEQKEHKEETAQISSTITALKEGSSPSSSEGKTGCSLIRRPEQRRARLFLVSSKQRKKTD